MSLKQHISLAFLGTALFFLGAFTFSTTTGTVINKIQLVTPMKAPVLARIAKCESDGSQFLHGQVITHANRNGSVDIGKYQINIRKWGKRATKLHYNLATLKGNTAMAQYIYLNYGTGAWYLSAKCWR